MRAKFLFALAFIFWISAELSVGMELTDIVFNNRSYIGANSTVRLIFSSNTTNATAQLGNPANISYTLIFNNISIPLTENSSELRFSLNTSTLGSNVFTVVLLGGNTTIYNDSFVYQVTNDWDNDGFPSESYNGTDCNDTNPNVNPAMPEIYSNHIDDDCNSSTSDEFTKLSSVKENYKLGEFVIINISTTRNLVCLEIFDSASNSVVYRKNITGKFPKLLEVDGIKKPGNYSIAIENGGFLTVMDSFEIENSLRSEIIIEPSEPATTEEVTFEVRNPDYGFPPYTYLWSFGDGETAQGDFVGHTYISPGTYQVVLNMSDDMGNYKLIKKKLKVVKSYDVALVVKDSSTKIPIKGVDVIISDTRVTTDAKGRAKFQLSAGKHHVEFYHADYKLLIETLKITKAGNFEFFMDKIYRDEEKPIIELIKPENSASTSDDEIILSYRAKDSSNFQCELLLSKDKNWWESKAKSDEGKNNTPVEVTIEQLKNGTYYWKVSCVDAVGNKAETDVRSFTVSIEPDTPLWRAYLRQVDKITNETNNFKMFLDELRLRKGSFNIKQNKVLELLGWEKQLNRFKKEMDYIARDVYNLRFRKVNASERLVLAKNYSRKLEAIKNETISNVNVIKEQSLVYYPSNDALDNISELYIAANGFNDSRLSFGSYKEKNKELQNELSITTSFIQLRLDYYNNRSEQLTIVAHFVKLNTSQKNITLIEFIPKSIASNASEIQLLTDAKVLFDDPLLEYSPETKQIVFALPDLKTIEELKGCQLAVLSTNVIPETTKITGFSISKLFHFEDSSSVWFLVALVIVIILVYYLTASVGLLSRLLSVITHKPEYKSLEKLHSLLYELNELIDNNELEQADVLFREMELFYNSLSPEKQEQLYPEVEKAADKINLAKLNIMFSNAIYLVENSRKQEAVNVFNKLLYYYKQLSDRVKLEVRDRLVKLKNVIEQNGASS